MFVERFTAAAGPQPVDSVASESSVQYPVRRWGAIIAVDVVEYSRLTSQNEEQTYLQYKSHRRELIDPKIAEFGARFLKSTGDGVMAEFETALDAARCAVHVQRGMVERCQGEAAETQIVFRIGVSCGRILADPEDIYGHDVNVAARLQTLAPPGGIVMTEEVADRVRDGVDLPLEDLGLHYFKNMHRPVRVFQCRFAAERGEKVLADSVS
ncbi:adenylate/guanylate cyclase domain-containing protein [Bradyrhizobium jicamae]|uniref:Adenylate/guanylate cyclase domain-containing protein n=1 Tax=Bradyrhizobium jicamae TaxID=280332 RepID=A0ABS5FMB4_9BRAD|nr:adenylate/guanylate cyclase domain-containing protein [Bradyrhizobium jicamae]MBR0797922.1 adenylate/guanylate cyclase domain-containing protein [Bradyrhizobium jicamae]MBR0931936.1 adenylate/guanylate cyclase domain-containing protein [Bradyrhizobium jicamae]